MSWLDVSSAKCCHTCLRSSRVNNPRLTFAFTRDLEESCPLNSITTASVRPDFPIRIVTGKEASFAWRMIESGMLMQSPFLFACKEVFEQHRNLGNEWFSFRFANGPALFPHQQEEKNKNDIQVPYLAEKSVYDGDVKFCAFVLRNDDDAPLNGRVHRKSTRGYRLVKRQHVVGACLVAVDVVDSKWFTSV